MIRLRAESHVVSGILITCAVVACSPAGDAPIVEASLTETPQSVPLTPGVTSASYPTPDEPTQSPTSTPTDHAQSPTAMPLPDFGPFRFVARFEPEGSFVSFYDRLDSTADGELYATLDGSATYHLEGDRWVLVVDGAPADILGVDEAGRVWAASDSLTAAWDGGSWTEYGADDGWIYNPIQGFASPYNLLSATDGTVWMTTEHDVRAFNGERWRTYTYADMTMGPIRTDGPWSQFSLAEVDGDIWVGECTFGPLGPVGGVGARWFDGEAWHGADSPAATGCVTEVAVAPDGAVWLDVGPTLYRYDPVADVWAGYPLPAPPEEQIARFGEITEMSFDASRDPWLGLTTCGGAHCYMGLARYHFERASGTYHLLGSQWPIESRLHVDARGQGWLFQLGEVSRLEGDRFEPVSYLMVPLPFGTTQTPDGTIWAIGELEGHTGLWQISLTAEDDEPHSGSPSRSRGAK